MRAYGAILATRFRLLLQYRAAALAGFGTQLFWGLLRVMIFTAFYESATAAPPMALDDTITYIWLGQATLVILPWNLDRELARLIHTGDVIGELVRPVDLYWAWFARAVALRTAPTLLRMLPMLVVAGLLFGLEAPASLAAGLAFSVSLVGAVLLSAAITMALTATLFWTIAGTGVTRLVPPFVMLCSGMIVPLPLFPDGARTLLELLPFRGIVDAPFRLYCGHIPTAELPACLLHQTVWIVALVLLGRWLVHRGLRVHVVQGG